MKFRFTKKKKKRTQKETALGKRRKRLFKLKIAGTIFALIAILFALGWFFRIPSFLITEVVIAGNENTATEVIEEVVNDVLSGTYVYIAPRNNSLVFPHDELEQTIEDVFPRIEKATVKKLSKTKLRIEIEERAPFALWCGVEYVEPGECYFLDTAGYVYAKAPNFGGNVFFKYYGTLVSAPTTTEPLGEHFMEQVPFDTIQVLLKQFRDLGFDPVSFRRVDAKDTELRLSSGARIIYGTETRLDVVLDNLESVLESEGLREVPLAEIEYVDLRFGNKVYYKLLGEEEVGPPGTEE